MRGSSKVALVTVAAGGLLLAGVAPASAAPMRPTAGNACASSVIGDADGSGYADPVVGIPDKHGLDGQAVVLRGTSGGVVGGAALAPGTGGVPGSAKEGGRFGASIAQGDIDGDRCADIAIAAPTSTTTSRTAPFQDFGSVTVLYGTPSGGYSTRGPQRVDAATLGLGLPAHVAAGDKANRSLTKPVLGDFIGDGSDDLAVLETVQDFTTDTTYADVLVVPGTPDGLDLDADGIQHVAVRGLSSGPGGTFEGITAQLSAGSVRDSRVSDLAVAVTTAGVTGSVTHGDVGNHGVVDVLYGGSHPFTTTQEWDLESPGVPGTDVTGRDLDLTATFGDFDGDGHDDLAFASSGTSRVTVLYGTPTGLRTAGVQQWHDGRDGVLGPYDGSGYGVSLIAGDFNGDNDDELVVGVADGSISILAGTHANGLTAVGDLRWSQATDGVPGAKEQGTQFGRYLAVGNIGHGGEQDLLVGDPAAGKDAGSVTEFFGGATRNVGLVKTGSKAITEGTPGIPGDPIAGDEFGTF
jgi:hypothetical protein